MLKRLFTSYNNHIQLLKFTPSSDSPRSTSHSSQSKNPLHFSIEKLSITYLSTQTYDEL